MGTALRCWPSPSSAQTGTSRCWPSRSRKAVSTAVTAWMVVRRSNVCRPRPPASRPAKVVRTSLSTRCQSPTRALSMRGRASSSVWRMGSPPGTSATPVRPALSVRISRLRVKNGACAPERFSSMLSRPVTGITRTLVIRGVFAAAVAAVDASASVVKVMVVSVAPSRRSVVQHPRVWDQVAAGAPALRALRCPPKVFGVCLGPPRGRRARAQPFQALCAPFRCAGQVAVEPTQQGQQQARLARYPLGFWKGHGQQFREGGGRAQQSPPPSRLECLQCSSL